MPSENGKTSHQFPFSMTLQKDAKTRRFGLYKKANTYHRKFGAQAVVIIKDGGTWYTYGSPGFLTDLIGLLDVSPENRLGSDHFQTVSERQQQKGLPGLSSSSGSEGSPHVFPNTPASTPLQALHRPAPTPLLALHQVPALMQTRRLYIKPLRPKLASKGE